MGHPSLPGVPSEEMTVLFRERPYTWAEMANIGTYVKATSDRRGHLDFGMVLLPGTKERKRIRITGASTYGERFASKKDALDCLKQILGESIGTERPLAEVLLRYVISEGSEVLFLWNNEFLPSLRRRRGPERITDNTLREFELYEGRGNLKHWEGIHIQHVTHGQLRQWVGGLYESGLKEGTVRLLVGKFRAFLVYCVDVLELIQRLPKMPVVSVPVGKHLVPSMDDLQRLLSVMPEEKRGLFMVRPYMGLRPSESRRLDVRDYDFDSRILTIPAEKSKMKKGRELPVLPEYMALHDWLVKYRKGAHLDEPLFYNSGGHGNQRWCQRSESRAYITAEKACGFAQHVKPNSWGRRFFITNELAQGSNEYAVMLYAGHADLKTTTIYNETTPVALALQMRPKYG